MTSRKFNLAPQFCFALVLACSGEQPHGIAVAEDGPGPHVVFDLTARPLPEIPFPNDLATRLDSTSPTGRRLNISLDAPTKIERDVRRNANRLEGFGTYAPISVRFTLPLDLANIVARQRGNRDLADDTVLLINISYGTKGFAKTIPLDFGHGNFPLTVSKMNAYFDNDPRRNVPNLFFDTTDEDKNGNGVLDPGEDTDGDGLLDKPNLFAVGTPGLGRPVPSDPLMHAIDGIVSFYEVATNTLIVRPILPLEQESVYAVVLTKALKGVDGNRVRSPFPFVNHARQTDALRHLPAALALHGLSVADVAFAWTYTTQGPTRDLEALRRGLYGVGPFARLADEFAPNIDVLPALSDGATPWLLPSARLKPVLELVASAMGRGSPAGVQSALRSYDNVDYFIIGELEGPNFLADRDGVASLDSPGDSDEVWDIDRLSGRGFYGGHKIPFWCAVPRKDRGSGAPFPVAFYAHGYGVSRIELLAFAGNTARYGIATCTVESFSHGTVVPTAFKSAVRNFFNSEGLVPLLNALSPGRARDLNNDGEPDNGGDFWSADTFHTRDAVRQSVLDTLAVIRAVRSFDGKRRFKSPLAGGAGVPELAGDFDGDGVVDFGGRGVDYFTWGSSMGGIISSIVAAIEPAIVAAAPVSGGAGLSDVGIRSSLGGVYDAVILPVMGPIFVGEPSENPGEVVVSTIVNNVNNRSKNTIFTTTAVAPGDRVEIENLKNKKRYEATVDSLRRFRLHIAADALDSVEKRALLKMRSTPPGETPPSAPDTLALGDPVVIRVFNGIGLKAAFDKFGVDVAFDGVTYPAGAPLVALARGLGLQRNTPDFRRFIGIAQTILEPADPINYAPHYFKDPLPSLDYDDALPGTNIVVISTAGDTTVPVATGIATARAAGIIEIDRIDPRYGKSANDVLIDNFVVEGLSWTRRWDNQPVVLDVDDFSRGVHEPSVPRLNPPLRLTVPTATGVSGYRIPLLNPQGQHVFGLPEPESAFDNPTFLIHMVGRYFQTRGQELRDDPCMATASCSWIPTPSPPR